MLRFYLVPKIGTGLTEDDPFRPKYIGDMTGVAWSGMDYGIDGDYLVGATLSTAQHTFVASQSDALVVPPLDTAVGGNPVLNQIRNQLEQRRIPGNWIQATTLHRAVLGRIGRLSIILQRFGGRHGKRLFAPGVGLDGNLNEDLLAQLTEVGTTLKLQTSALSLSTTVRQGLLYLADQLPPFGLAGETF